MKRIIFATHSPGKIREMRDILAGLEVEIISAEDAGIFEDPAEDGETFQENALKKAKFVSERTGEWVLADDSGLCIEALNGLPGVKSARWAGDREAADLTKHTLDQMKNVSEGRRQAYFETAAVLYSPNGRHWFFEGTVKGIITFEPRGTPLPKLQYDVIFVPDGHNRTFAEMSAQEKNAISHRGEAFGKLKKFIEDVIKSA